MDNEITRLDWLLSRIQLLDPPYQESAGGKQLYQEICKLVFEDQLYVRIWSEPTLNQLEQLFQTEKPNEELFKAELEEIRKRTIAVREVNDCFFGIVDPNTTSKDLCELLAKLECLPEDFNNRLDVSGRLQEIRNQDRCTFEKVESFLEILKDDLNVDLTAKDSIKAVLESLKSREAVGKVNALLVKGTAKAIAVSLHIKLQVGTGQVSCQVKGSEDFKDAVGRAQSAMRERGFLFESEDIFYTLDLTDARYQGSSLGLAAAVAMHDVKLNLATDPYTAFTGDINLDGQEWTIKPVSGVSQKTAAAKRAGCRRVFIPRLNCAEITGSAELQICGVDSLIDLFVQLRPNRQLLPSESLQGRKITVLQRYCMERGWDLPAPQPIQAGIQFSIVPLEIPPLKVQIYNSGTHTPKTISQNEYLELVSLLNKIDQPETPIRSINQTLTVQSSTLQDQIQSAIEKLKPTESRSEQYCKYSFKFSGKNETLTIKQYNSGKLTLQGSAGPLYKSVLECILPLYKIHFPKSDISVDSLLGLNTTKPIAQGQASTKELADVPLPHIGTDESGKGDYFGPMVIAGVLIDSTTETALKELGVKDSKALTDKRCKELAVKIRNLLPGKYQEVEIPPDRYNQLYEEFKAEGKNLNHLLAWGHARAIESLLQKETCSHAIADQFGDENYIRSKLMEKGKKLQLIQLSKGERYIAVAAASILARDKFLSRMENLRDTSRIELPKGASDSVVNAGKQFVQTYGEDSLGKVAKLHHKTTEKIRGSKHD
jgi:ribonuclease HIII